MSFLNPTEWFAFRRKSRSNTVDITTSATPIRRGDSVRLDLTVPNGVRGKRLRVGLVCTELYDVEEWSETTPLLPSASQSIVPAEYASTRATHRATAHEEWVEVDAAEASQGLTFTVPLDAPYSYRGSCLSFEWRAMACEITRLRPDPVASCVLEVRP